MKFDLITDKNFLIYATKKYDNPQCSSVDEFNEDLRRFSSVKRLLLRLARKDESVNIRMLLNHIIILDNIFGNVAAARMMFFYCEEHTHTYLKSFLLFLNILPDNIPEVNIKEIPINTEIINKLNAL